MGPLIPLFWTSIDVCFELQARVDPMLAFLPEHLCVLVVVCHMSENYSGNRVFPILVLKLGEFI